MAESLRTQYIRKLGLNPKKFNSIVHEGNFKAAETTRGKPRPVDNIEMIGIHTLANALQFGMATPTAGALANTVMKALRDCEAQGQDWPAMIRIQADLSDLKVTLLREHAKDYVSFGEGTGMRIDFDLTVIMSRISKITDEIIADMAAEKVEA